MACIVWVCGECALRVCWAWVRGAVCNARLAWRGVSDALLITALQTYKHPLQSSHNHTALHASSV